MTKKEARQFVKMKELDKLFGRLNNRQRLEIIESWFSKNLLMDLIDLKIIEAIKEHERYYHDEGRDTRD